MGKVIIRGQFYTKGFTYIAKKGFHTMDKTHAMEFNTEKEAIGYLELINDRDEAFNVADWEIVPL